MRNLYSLTKGPQVIHHFARAIRGDVGNMPPLPGIFPDYSAQIVHSASGGRELVTARWGVPSASLSSRAQERPGRDQHPERVLAALARWLGVEGPLRFLTTERDAEVKVIYPEAMPSFAANSRLLHS
jgi:hypothetical protein